MRQDIQEAIEYAQNNPDLSIASVAKEFGIPSSTLQRRLKQPLKGKDAKVAHKHLSSAEEKALCAYIDRLDRINLSVRAEFVRDAANSIIAAKMSPSMPREVITTVGPTWVARFIKRHEYASRPQKILDLKRAEAENKEVILNYFQNLTEVITSNGITPADIWNMDETGFRIGIGSNAIEAAIASDPNFSPSKAALLGRFIKGALFNAAEGVQLRKDLSRTDYATAMRSKRRSTKNHKLQAGGIMTVREAREMLVQRKEDDIIKAQRIIKAHEKKRLNSAKRVFTEAAKKARYWRGQGLLGPAEIIETGRGKRMLIRF
ncbi:hypothetical protein S40293_10138 [Stachybotrys chartarum IBT 40293]|nr:hypothetical protein S40293_10138 [Stachybotrys chartarum IBT 40293]